MTTPAHLVQNVRSSLLANGRRPSTQSVYAALRSERHVVDSSGLMSLVDEVKADLDGFGPLEPWLWAPDVTDILVNGSSEVWVDRGCGLELTTTKFRDDESLRRLVHRLVSHVGRRLDDSCPYVDVDVAGGLRLHAVLPPVSDRLCVSIRVPRRARFTMSEFRANNTLTGLTADALQALVNSRRAFLVSGGTGSGKTTVLNTLLALIEPRHRLVIVEDTTELRPDHPHVVHLQSRTENVEGSGAVSMRDLVRQALRMRPDRLVVGEARGAEVVDLMAALNTGHEGGCGTVHANTSSDVPSRIEALAASGGMDRNTAHSQLSSAIQAVVHLSRRSDSSRFVSELAVLDRASGDVVVATPALLVSADGTVAAGPAWDKWQTMVGMSR